MKILLTIFIFIISSQLLIAQEKCESKESSLMALNTIDKCTTKPIDKKNLNTTRRITLKETSSRIRFLKRETSNTSSKLRSKEQELALEKQTDK